MKAIVVEEFSGPEVLRELDVERPEPGPGQVRVEVAVAGVNFLDVYQRIGATPLGVPFRAGVEGVGTVTALGEGVTEFVLGQRVGWLSGGQGSFSEFTVVDAEKAVSVPDSIDDETAAACLMQGVTAQYLTTDTYPVRAGDTVLVHAAAGGVGLMLTQMVKRLGGRVIGTVSSDAKAEVAHAAVPTTWSGTTTSSKPCGRSPTMKALPWSTTELERRRSTAAWRPCATRVPGDLRSLERPAAASGHRPAELRRIAVCHPSDRCPLHQDARRAAGTRCGCLDLAWCGVTSARVVYGSR